MDERTQRKSFFEKPGQQIRGYFGKKANQEFTRIMTAVGFFRLRRAVRKKFEEAARECPASLSEEYGGKRPD